MYDIHIYVNGFYIPLVITFLPTKSFECYRFMWNFICQLCADKIGKKITSLSIHLDFEIAAHKAFLNVFPYSKIKACTFHLGQSWDCKINSLSNLKKLYKNQLCNIAKWLTLFFGLPYFIPLSGRCFFWFTKLNSRF